MKKRKKAKKRCRLSTIKTDDDEGRCQELYNHVLLIYILTERLFSRMGILVSARFLALLFTFQRKLNIRELLRLFYITYNRRHISSRTFFVLTYIQIENINLKRFQFY